MIAEWVTNNCEEIPVTAMTRDHITNCIWFLRSGQMIRPGCNGFTNQEWELIFIAELRRRSRQNVTL